MSILLTNLYVLRAAAPHLYDVDVAPAREHLIVLGAAVRQGRPTSVLAARLRTAAGLFHAGRAERLIVSGHAEAGYDEPTAMAAYLEELGVAAERIELDAEGPRTFESFASAARRGVQSAIVVTTSFHLARAVFLARRFGLDAVGVAAEDPGFARSLRAKWAAREALARARAVWDVALSGSSRGC
jgi:vancomycin permeability regulator SanA